MLDLKDKAYNFIRLNGPSLPVKVAKEVGRDILFTSAVLSELVSDKKVKYSNTKVGGSPLYYVEGQELKLQSLYSKLGEKPKQAYDLLRKKGVLRDAALEPWTRIALREIKDFAKPIEVKLGDKIEIFWRWYMLSLDDSKKKIVVLVKGEEEAKPSKIIEEKKLDVEEVKEEVKLEQEVQSRLPSKVEVKEVKQERKVESELLNEVSKFFVANEIKVLKKKIIRKNTEADYVVEVPSQLGILKYYVKVRKKKKLNEGDLSLAFNKGQEKKLPVLFLGTGELTKKARRYMDENMNGYLLFKQI